MSRHRIIKNLLSLCVAVGILAVAASFLSVHTSGEKEPAPVSSRFSIPDVPSEVSFAGERVVLDRYDLYERYERELTTTCYMHSTTLLTLKRANRYMPIIEPILKKNGIPADFIYLAAIESHFNPRAYSAAGAAGIWQFMPKTARQYGLEVNDYIDERYNVEKATVAACKYLKNAYAKYGNWLNAAASYNAGMGRITTEIDKQGENCTLDLFLNEETSRYVFRILAIKQVLAAPADYGFVLRANQLYQPIKTRAIEVDTTIENLAEWAQQQGTTYFQLKEFNPWLRARSMPDKSRKKYVLQIPVEQDMYYTPDRKYKSYRKEWVVK